MLFLYCCFIYLIFLKQGTQNGKKQVSYGRSNSVCAASNLLLKDVQRGEGVFRLAQQNAQSMLLFQIHGVGQGWKLGKP